MHLKINNLQKQHCAGNTW